MNKIESKPQPGVLSKIWHFSFGASFLFGNGWMLLEKIQSGKPLSMKTLLIAGFGLVASGLFISESGVFPRFGRIYSSAFELVGKFIEAMIPVIGCVLLLGFLIAIGYISLSAIGGLSALGLIFLLALIFG